MKKLLFFLLLTTAVVGRAQTSLDLLPAGTEAPDFRLLTVRRVRKSSSFQIRRLRRIKTERRFRVSGPCSISGLPGVQTAEETCRW